MIINLNVIHLVFFYYKKNIKKIILLKDLRVILRGPLHMKHPQVIGRYKRITFILRHASASNSRRTVQHRATCGASLWQRRKLRRFATPTRWEQAIFRTFNTRHKCLGRTSYLLYFVSSVFRSCLVRNLFWTKLG